ncbi:MAG: hypothetical protein JWQ66_370 [Mucilaginibacter sp.]|nr:hypothetical protein [Mucilaginibacter sp.]
MSEVSNSIGQLPGFKISDSHFRIGSKIHISNFYYAKRFFQNSFFSSRIAFIIANDIRTRTTKEMLAGYHKDGLTLIGYGIYSELLLSLLEKFLRIAWDLDNLKLNHNLVLDSENLALVKQHPLLPNVLIVVPIASTFGTAIKIEEELRRKLSTIKPVYPHINVLYISDTPQDTPTKLEEDFGWDSKDLPNKTIKIKAYFEGGTAQKEQKFYLSLASKWYHIDDCPLCFPKKGEEEDLCAEIPLFETDRTSVTPTSIFNLPQARSIKPEDMARSFVLNENLVQYGHHTRNNSHFLFSIKTEEFLTINYVAVSDWLEHLKTNLLKKLKIQDSDHVLIVSSCHYSNAAFIDLVNEKLFSSAASIIHYDPTNDYIQNFEMIYGHEIKNADKILFVDDALKSGTSFSKIFEFVDYTLSQDSSPNVPKGIAACLLLINISQDFTVKAVQRRLVHEDAVFAFANLHLHTSLSHDEESPLVIEAKRYRELVDDSFLDSLKTHFLRQCEKLAAQEREYIDAIKKSRHLDMLEVTHRIYQYFRTNDQEQFHTLTFEQFRDAVFDPERIPFSFAVFKTDTDSKFPPHDAALLKVLSQSPFVQYEPLRKKAFSWIIGLLDKLCHEVTIEMADGQFDYGTFESLKFLIRRAGLLNSNYLISKKMLTFLEQLYGATGIGDAIAKVTKEHQRYQSRDDLFAKTESLKAEKKLENLNEFSVFYAAQIKELLLRNENRTIHLEKILTKFQNSAVPGFRQLVRILKDENCIIVKKFHEFLAQQIQWQQLYTARKVNEGFDPIIKLLTEIKRTKHHKYLSLEKFLNPVDDSLRIDPTADYKLLIYLWLMYFLASDKKAPKLSLEKKTDLIFKKLKELCRQHAEITRLGIFFIVKSSPESEPIIVYDKNVYGSSTLDIINWKKNNPHLVNFLDGAPDPSKTYHKSVVEYTRKENTKKWQDLYALAEGTIEPGLDADLLSKEEDRLILIRLNKRISVTDQKPQGVIGLYFKNSLAGSTEITNPDLVRYLQLLRTPLSQFVEAHHENNEFRDWQVAEATRKLMLLSGHGKEMLRLLAEDRRYLNIAEHLEYLQMIIMLNKSVSDKGGEDDITRRFNEFYHVAGEKMIDEGFFREIEDLAKDIYARPQIEDTVDCDVKLNDIGDGFPFAFNKNILMLICFELVVNAKKNRWHFLPGKSVGNYTKNTLTINAAVETTPAGKKKLKIEITNIGPKMNNDEFLKLKNPNKNLKSDDAVAGTALLKTLLYRFLNGRLDYETKPIDEEQRLSSFKAIITLPEME